jgi:broad specificity phosphatase PhoE
VQPWPPTTGSNVGRMSVFLVRHAHAGNRSGWRGADEDRPLSRRGLAQAQGLAELLGDRGVTSVSSSPARRCVQTIEPLARSLKLEVVLDKRLAEGSSVKGALDALLGGGDGQVLCAHGDLIPALMAHLVDHGLRASGAERCQKGSVWEIELERGKPVKARYRTPPSV